MRVILKDPSTSWTTELKNTLNEEYETRVRDLLYEIRRSPIDEETVIFYMMHKEKLPKHMIDLIEFVLDCSAKRTAGMEMADNEMQIALQMIYVFKRCHHEDDIPT